MFLVARVKEPWWHRRARARRSYLRKALRRGAWKLWSTKRVVRTATLLQAHHGSCIPSKVWQHLVGQAVFPTMTSWTCRFCNLRLQVHVSHCTQCSRHWKQAQTTSRSKSRRSKSKNQTQPKQMTQKPNSNSKDGAHSAEEAEEKDEIFQQKLPWVVSSPHSRVQTFGPTDAVQAGTPEDKSGNAVTAVESKTPAQPEQSEQEVLTHLKALKKALGALPEELETQLQTLEAKTDKTLTHGHINKLGKLQRQLASLGTRISEMDHNWKVFTEKVMMKFAHHQQMYQQCRQGLLQEFQKKSQEIQAAKEEVQHASVALFQAQVAEPPPPAETVDVEQMFEPIAFDSYMEMEEVEESPDPNAELLPDKPRPQVGAFRRLKAASPTKVHAGHLKKQT